MPASIAARFIAGSAALASAPALARRPASGERRCGDHRRRRSRHRGGAQGRGGRPALRRWSRRATAIGGRCVTDTDDVRRAVRSRRALDAHAGHQSGGEARRAAPASRSIRRRPARGCASAGAMRAKARWRISSPRIVRANRAIADAARARPTSPARRRCRRTSATGGRPSSSCSGRSAAARISTEISAVDFARSAERDVDAFCRQGFGALLAKLGDGPAGAASTPVTRIDWRATRSRSRPRAGRITARAVDRHGVDRRARGRQDQVHARSAEAPARRDREALARQPTITSRWSCTAIRCGLRSDDLVFEKSTARAPPRCSPMSSGTPLCMVEVGGKFGASSPGQGEAAMVGLRDRLARRPLRHRRQEGGRQARHATRWSDEPCALGAFSAAAPGGQPARRDADGAAARPRLVRRRSRARDAVGHGRRRLGIRRARRRCGAARLWGGREEPVSRRDSAARSACAARTADARAFCSVGEYPGSPRLRGSTSCCIACGTQRFTPAARRPCASRPRRRSSAPTASISSSVMVFSRGCSVTAIAIDFLPASMPVPS